MMSVEGLPSTMDEIGLVVLDMAGTTIEDRGQVVEAFTAVLGSHGIEVTGEALQAVRGASKREAIARLVKQQFDAEGPEDATLAGKIFIDFREHLAAKFSGGGVSPVPGAGDTLAWLRARGIKVALNTGFDRAITDLILSGLGWDRGAVDAVICGDDVPRGRPAPYLIFRAMEKTGVVSVHQVANVGDTLLDLEAGWNAGVRWNIGVLSGAHTRERLERGRYTHLISSVAELPSLWKVLVEA